MEDRLHQVAQQALQFRDARDWKQFHDPKNLAEAISIEAGELLENFLWLKPEETKVLETHKINKIEEEVADIAIFAIYLCDALKIDLAEAIERKLEANERKYPIAKSKGNHIKYREL